MKRLITMTDFVLGEVNTPLGGQQVASIRHVEGEKYRKIYRYANFLKQPLKLSLFVPCDEEGNVLEEPSKKIYPASMSYAQSINSDLVQYQQAKSRVIFEGFIVKDGLTVCDENSILHIFWNYEGKWVLSKGLETIEDLVKFNLELKNENQIF
jgi:hypothetical protein